MSISDGKFREPLGSLFIYNSLLQIIQFNCDKVVAVSGDSSSGSLRKPKNLARTKKKPFSKFEDTGRL